MHQNFFRAGAGQMDNRDVPNEEEEVNQRKCIVKYEKSTYYNRFIMIFHDSKTYIEK